MHMIYEERLIRKLPHLNIPFDINPILKELAFSDFKTFSLVNNCVDLSAPVLPLYANHTPRVSLLHMLNIPHPPFNEKA